MGHKLSKIEITLVPSGEYTADDLDRATVTVCNVVPTVSMNLADGSISSAYGTPINITPRKTGKVDFEAIVPPQSKPLNMIQVNLGGNIIKVDVIPAVEIPWLFPWMVTVSVPVGLSAPAEAQRQPSSTATAAMTAVSCTNRFILLFRPFRFLFVHLFVIRKIVRIRFSLSSLLLRR